MVNREKKAKSVLGLEALCRLLSHHPHFNFRSNILKLVVQFANSKVIEVGSLPHLHQLTVSLVALIALCLKVSSLCCNCLREVFRTDMNGEISLESLKLIASMVKSASQRISPNLLQVLSSLK